MKINELKRLFYGLTIVLWAQIVFADRVQLSKQSISEVGAVLSASSVHHAHENRKIMNYRLEGFDVILPKSKLKWTRGAPHTTKLFSKTITFQANEENHLVVGYGEERLESIPHQLGFSSLSLSSPFIDNYELGFPRSFSYKAERSLYLRPAFVMHGEVGEEELAVELYDDDLSGAFEKGNDGVYIGEEVLPRTFAPLREYYASEEGILQIKSINKKGSELEVQAYRGEKATLRVNFLNEDLEPRLVFVSENARLSFVISAQEQEIDLIPGRYEFKYGCLYDPLSMELWAIAPSLHEGMAFRVKAGESYSLNLGGLLPEMDEAKRVNITFAQLLNFDLSKTLNKLGRSKVEEVEKELEKISGALRESVDIAALKKQSQRVEAWIDFIKSGILTKLQDAVSSYERALTSENGDALQKAIATYEEEFSKIPVRFAGTSPFLFSQNYLNTFSYLKKGYEKGLMRSFYSGYGFKRQGKLLGKSVAEDELKWRGKMAGAPGGQFICTDEGELVIPEDGEYTFILTNTDTTRMAIADVVHFEEKMSSGKSRRKALRLKKGLHRIKLDYATTYANRSTRHLQLEWIRPGGHREVLSWKNLIHKPQKNL